VELEGTGVDGVYGITVLDANDFRLNGTAGQAYAAGAAGYVVDYQVLPAVAIPNGGELVDPATSGAVAEAQQNFQPWVYRLLGKYRLYDLYSGANPNAPVAQPWEGAGGYWAQSGTVGVGFQPVSGAGIFQFLNGAQADAFLISLDQLKNGAGTTHPPNIKIGDVLEVEFSYSTRAAGGETGSVLMYPTLKIGATVLSQQSAGKMYDAGTAINTIANVTNRARFVATAAGAGSVSIAMQAANAAPATGSPRVTGPASVRVAHYRPNP
jgi:hypothetical protein